MKCVLDGCQVDIARPDGKGSVEIIPLKASSDIPVNPKISEDLFQQMRGMNAWIADTKNSSGPLPAAAAEVLEDTKYKLGLEIIKQVTGAEIIQGS